MSNALSSHKSPFETRMPFWVYNNTILGQNTVSFHTLTGLECTFEIQCPFGPRIPFRAMKSLSGLSCPFRTNISFWAKMPLQDQNALLCQAYSFGPQLPYWDDNALFYRECHIGPIMPFWDVKNNQPQQTSQTTISNIRYHVLFSCYLPPCAMSLINQTESVAKKVCHGVFHGLLINKSTEMS